MSAHLESRTTRKRRSELPERLEQQQRPLFLRHRRIGGIERRVLLDEVGDELGMNSREVFFGQFADDGELSTSSDDGGDERASESQENAFFRLTVDNELAGLCDGQPALPGSLQSKDSKTHVPQRLDHDCRAVIAIVAMHTLRPQHIDQQPRTCIEEAIESLKMRQHNRSMSNLQHAHIDTPNESRKHSSKGDLSFELTFVQGPWR